MKITLRPDKDIQVQKIRIGRIPALILRPVKRSSIPVAVLWIHGGGYVTGMKEMVYMSRAVDLIKKYGATVVSPGYRLAWQKPYPAAVNDCYQVLEYMHERFETIMVGGESAGGGLAVAVCMMARDRGILVDYQMPLYPMIDNEDTESSKDNHAPIWNTKKNHSAWKLYLRGLEGKEVPAYAAPARQTDYSNLPPAYTFVGDIEPFYCETLTYIKNLQKAGIEAKVDVYPNCFHAFDMMLPFKKVSKEAIAEFEKQFCYAVKHYFAPQKK